MEKVVLDLGAYVRHAKEKLGYQNVVLLGWSGGGSLSLFYQAEAENPTLKETPAGDPVDLTAVGLIPADAVMFIAAHKSRAVTLTEWLDASVLDELDPDARDPELDIYNLENINQPPFTRCSYPGTVTRRLPEIERSQHGFGRCWKIYNGGIMAKSSGALWSTVLWRTRAG